MQTANPLLLFLLLFSFSYYIFLILHLTYFLFFPLYCVLLYFLTYSLLFYLLSDFDGVGCYWIKRNRLSELEIRQRRKVVVLAAWNIR